MNKKFILAFLLCIVKIQSTQNLLIFSGCENEESSGATHTPLLYALTFKNDPILVSGSILRYTLNEKCEANVCKNILEENEILERFDIYYYRSFFLFIPKKSSVNYQNIFNLNQLKPINLEAEPEKQFAKRLTCSFGKDPSYLTKNLLSEILNKKTELNIYLTGHGEFIFENGKSNFLSNLNKLTLDLTSLNSNQLEALKKDIFTDDTQKILKKYNLDIKNFLTQNSLDDLKNYISAQIQLIEDINTYLMDDYSYIAEIPITEFIEILRYLNSNTKTKLLYIVSCFSGGLNSILPFFSNKINLKQDTYNFDIISTSNSESIYTNMSKQAAGLVTKENSLDLFYELNKKTSYENAYNEILNKFSKNAYIDPSYLALPIIRKKNSTNWFPILPSIKNENFTFYSITKILNDVYTSENKNFVLNFPSASLVSTSCITTPIETKYRNRIIIRNLLNVYIKELIFKLDNEDLRIINRRIGHLQKEFKSDFKYISILDGLYKAFKNIPEDGILIEKLKIDNIEENNIKIYEKYNQISLEIENKYNTILATAEKDEFENLGNFNISPLMKKNWFNSEKEAILKNCPKADYKNIIQALNKKLNL